MSGAAPLRIARGAVAGAVARVGACAVALALGCAQPPAPPNLLLISVDTLRADALACYGGPPDVGSAICSLADGGTRFVWAFSTAPLTAPSVASLLTSQYPVEHGVAQSAFSYLSDEALTVAEILAERGYATAAVVSNPVLDRNKHLQQGFASYDDRMTRRERNRPGFEEREAGATSDAAIAWAQVEAREPWFLWVHYQDPHGPYDPPGARAPGPSAGDAPGDEGPRLRVLPGDSGYRGIPAYQRLPGLASFGAYRRRYLDEVRYLDAHVGRLVARLDALGTAPAVLLTADHGEALGEDDFYFAHGHSVGLDQIRVPLLWRPAGTSDGDRGAADVVATPVGAVDVAPTLLAAAGAPLPASFRGRPLPVSGAPRPRAVPIFAEQRRRVAIVSGGTFFERPRPDSPGPAAGLPALGAREAELRPDGTTPRYAPPSAAAAALEPQVEAFAGRPRAAAPRHDRVPESVRRRLRALGYAEQPDE